MTQNDREMLRYLAEVIETGPEPLTSLCRSALTMAVGIVRAAKDYAAEIEQTIAT
jgi:hypothetical protein